MLTKDILKRIEALRDKLGPKHSAGGTIPILPDAEHILNECVAILNAFDTPEDVRQAVFWKTMGDSLASHPTQHEVNLTVAQRMLNDLQDEERLENSIVYIKRTLAPDSL